MLSNSRRSRSICSLVALALAAVLPGCATYRNIAPYPSPGQPVTAAAGDAPLSRMSELPVGAYYDPEHRVVVNGHQKGLGVGFLFGVVGVLAADAANRSAASDKFGDDASQLGVDLVALTREILVERQPETGAPAVTVVDAAGQGLTVTPFAVFTVDKTGNARLYALLKASLPPAKKGAKSRWAVRYFAQAPGVYPLDGEEGWRSGQRFESGMRVALQRAVDALYAEVNGRTREVRKAKAKGRFAFINLDLDLPVIVLAEDDSTVTGRVAVGDAMVNAGTHILDRADYSWKDAEFKTPK